MSAAQRAADAIGKEARYMSAMGVTRDHIAGIIEQEYAGVVEALEAMTAKWSCNVYPAPCRCPYCQARAAIAKARGEA